MNLEVMRKNSIPFVLIFAAAAFSFSNSISNTFAWDDIYLVVKNPDIKDWGNITALFKSGYWSSIGKTGGLYRPLTMLSFMAEHSLAGLTPLLYHIDNIVLHFLCSAFVYLILKEIVTQRSAPLIATLIFAVHPVHSEAVAWVSGRAELLSSLFLLSSFFIFIKSSGRTSRYLASPLLFMLGLLSKETAAVLPAIILLYLLLIRRERRPAAVLRELAPFLIVLAVYLPLRLAVLQGEAAPPEHAYRGITAAGRFFIMVEALFNYIRLSFFPTDLRALYIFAPPSPFSPRVVLMFAIAAALLFAAPSLFKRRPALLFFLLWFFVALLPVSNVIPTEVIMTERAMYLPIAGFCAALGIAISGESARMHNRAVMAMLAGALICYTSLSAARNTVWKDNNTLHAELVDINKRLVNVFPGYMKSYLNLAQALMVTGKSDEALEILRQAVKAAPDDGNVRFTLASVYIELGRFDLAEPELLKAGQLGIDNDWYYTNMAAIQFEKGRLDDAEKSLRKAIEKNPKGSLQLLNYGRVMLAKGDSDAALSYFRRAGEYDPSLYEAFLQQGMVLGERRDYAGAAAALEKAVTADPSRPDAYLYLGAVLKEQGLNERAKEAFSKAVELDPSDARARAFLESLR